MLYFATSRGELNVIISRRTCGAGRPQVGLCPIFLVLRYRAVSILGSRPWPFRVTWCHWSRDHLIPNSQVAISYRCSIGTNSVSPAVIEIMGPNILGSWPWPLWVMWRQQLSDYSNLNGHFLLVVHRNQVCISSRFRDTEP